MKRKKRTYVPKKQHPPIPGHTIKYVREALDMTQRQFGDALGYAEMTIARAERAGARPHMRYALIGLLVTRGKPFGILWPDH